MFVIHFDDLIEAGRDEDVASEIWAEIVELTEDNGGSEGSWSAKVVDGKVTEFTRTA